MYSSQWNSLGDTKPQLEKKLSREEKKILDAIARMEKQEVSLSLTQAARKEIKAKAHQKETMLSSKVPKQPKIQINPSTDFIPAENSKKQGPAASSEEADKGNEDSRDHQPQIVINPEYKLANESDLFMHLIEYREAERQNFLQKSQKSLVGMPYLQNKGDIEMMNEELVQSTNTAFSMIQSKFEESRAKLRKPNSKEHKEFQIKFLNETFIKS